MCRHLEGVHVPRRNRAAERSTRRKGTDATPRSRADRRRSSRPLRCGARETGAARTGRAEGDRPWRGVSRVTEEQSEVVPRYGATHEGRRAEWLAGQVSLGHAAAAACDGKGTRVEGQYRTQVRDSDCGSSRMAQQN